MNEHTAENDAGSESCYWCGHASHEGDECGAVTGYDHMNGDHECGCPGRGLSEAEREHVADWFHSNAGCYPGEDALNQLVWWIEDRIIPPDMSGHTAGTTLRNHGLALRGCHRAND